MIRTALTIAGVGVALLGGLLIGFDKGQEAAVTTSVDRQNANMQSEFDRGMRAGQEYQEWFCTNTVDVEAGK